MNIRQLVPTFIVRQFNSLPIGHREKKAGIDPNISAVSNVNVHIPNASLSRVFTTQGDINDDEMSKMLQTINDNNQSLLSQNDYQCDAINSSMEVDMARMNYYIDDQLISVAGDTNKTLENYKLKVMDESRSHLKNNMAAISSFAHQGIFMIFYEAMSNFIMDDKSSKRIDCLTLDRNNTKNDFFFFSDGRIEFHSEAKIKNVLSKTNTVPAQALLEQTDPEASRLSLKLSFLLVKNHEGVAYITHNKPSSYNVALKYIPNEF
ncbi:TPA: hypothetical protein ACHVKA_000024 [Yersinia enterocolitica]